MDGRTAVGGGTIGKLGMDLREGLFFLLIPLIIVHLEGKVPHFLLLLFIIRD